MPDNESRADGTEERAEAKESQDKAFHESPRRNPPEDLAEGALGDLQGQKPAQDYGGADRPIPPEVPESAKKVTPT